VELFLRTPICLHGVVLNSLSTGTTLPRIVAKEKQFSFSSDLTTTEDRFPRILATVFSPHVTGIDQHYMTWCCDVSSCLPALHRTAQYTCDQSVNQSSPSVRSQSAAYEAVYPSAYHKQYFPF
jgi:hypothetical protein